jgi:hypothetical protein
MKYNALHALAPSLEREMLEKVAAALGEAPAPEVRILIGVKLNQMAAQMLGDAERVAGDLRNVADLITAPVTIWRASPVKPLVQDLRDALAGLIEHAQPLSCDDGAPDGQAWAEAFKALLRANREMPPQVPA